MRRNGKARNIRVDIRVNEEEMGKIRYFSAKSGMSKSDFIRDAIDLAIKIKHSNDDVDEYYD